MSRSLNTKAPPKPSASRVISRTAKAPPSLSSTTAMPASIMCVRTSGQIEASRRAVADRRTALTYTTLRGAAVDNRTGDPGFDSTSVERLSANRFLRAVYDEDRERTCLKNVVAHASEQE